MDCIWLYVEYFSLGIMGFSHPQRRMLRFLFISLSLVTMTCFLSASSQDVDTVFAGPIFKGVPYTYVGRWLACTPCNAYDTFHFVLKQDELLWLDTPRNWLFPLHKFHLVWLMLSPGCCATANEIQQDWAWENNKNTHTSTSVSILNLQTRCK